MKKNRGNLIEVEVKSKSFGRLSGTKIFLTQELQDSLAKRATIEILKQGRALRGFKHLIEILKDKDKNNTIIFTHEKTKKDGKNYYINYEEYRQKTSSRFYTVYRETGLDGASFFLNLHFPHDFDYDKAQITETQLRQINKRFPGVLKNLSEKAKNKRALLKQATDVVKQLREKKKILKGEIENLKKLQKESNIALFQKRIEELKSALKKDERLVSDDKLLKNRILELGLKLDKDLIKLQLTNSHIKMVGGPLRSLLVSLPCPSGHIKHRI